MNVENKTIPITGAKERQQRSGAATVWAAFFFFVPVAVIANLAVEAVPHVRGIGFMPQLRYAAMTSACAIAALATFLYRFLASHVDAPRRALRLILFAVALLVLALMWMFSSLRLAATAALPVIAIVIAVGFLVPRTMDRDRRRLVGAIVVVIVGVLEIAGVFAALQSERVPPSRVAGMAFDVPRALFDVDHKFIDLSNGVRVHYVDEGTGPVLLFLHGNPAWSFQWRDLIAGLRGSYRCVALDYPGFGLSPAAPGYGFTPREQSHVLEEFVVRLGLRDVTLVMQDWGGPIGLGLAGRRPELIRSVVLGNTWAWPTSTSEPRGKFSKIAGGPIGEFIQMNFNGFAAVAVKEGVVRELPADVHEMYVRPFRPMAMRGVAAFYPGQITAASSYLAEVESGLSRIRDRKALIFWGMQDRGFPRPDLERFEKIFPGHKTIELPNASHFSSKTRPGAWSRKSAHSRHSRREHVCR